MFLLARREPSPAAAPGLSPDMSAATLAGDLVRWHLGGAALVQLQIPLTGTAANPSRVKLNNETPVTTDMPKPLATIPASVLR